MGSPELATGSARDSIPAALIVDTDPSFVEAIAGPISAHGFDPVVANSLEAGRAVMRSQALAASRERLIGSVVIRRSRSMCE